MKKSVLQLKSRRADRELTPVKVLANMFAAYSPEEIDLLRQSEAAIRPLQGNINDARKMVFDMAAGFD